jgi:hypothetical protein
MKYRITFESQVAVDAMLKVENKDKLRELALSSLERGCMVGGCFSGVYFDELILTNDESIVRTMAQGLERLAKGGYFYLEVRDFFQSKEEKPEVKSTMTEQDMIDNLYSE